jgi:predicted phosphodiesterase
MRLLILSDLHHELWRDQAPSIDPAVSRPDVVILAGDINSDAHAVHWAAHTFAGLPVIYVHGNHEAYGRNLEHMQEHVATACALHPNVHFLNCNELVIGTVRFLGATLWTDFRLLGDGSRQSSMRTVEAGMNDYKRIRLASAGYRKLRTGDTARLHALHKSWLRQQLDVPFDGTTVVVTHMAPSLRSVHDDDASDELSTAYASQMEDVVENANLWVHGHLHRSLDYRIGQCRVVANPCGYPQRNGNRENIHFDPNWIVEVPGTMAR